MQLRPFLIKIKSKLRAWSAKYRPAIRPATIGEFYAKHWQGGEISETYLLGRISPQFFVNAKNISEYLTAMRSRFPDTTSKIVNDAKDILENKFNLLGSGQTDLGESINWHRDFKNGYEWPQLHYSRIKIVDLSNDADVKIPWELSRLQFLPVIGQAFWLTGDEKYREQFVRIIEHWGKKNPIDYGVNWTCSMEVAIRVINLIWGLYFFSVDSKLSSDMAKQTIRLIYYHGLHIERNLEEVDKGSNSNHLLANYLGLFYVGLLFPEFDRATKWSAIGRKGLEEEMSLQINADGADYECSLSYHRLVLEMSLTAYILGRRNDTAFSLEYEDCLTKMAQFSAAMTGPSGYTPAIGDNDDGFVLKLANENPHDHRALLDIAAQFFEIRIHDNVKVCPERMWYLGPESLNRWPRMMRRKPALFKKSGYAVIQNERFHLVFNACGIAEKGFGGHKHNDLLSVNLEIDSIPFLIDSGTACYTSNYKLRNENRATNAHNTISVDDEEQNRFLQKGLFFMFRDARPKRFMD
jgi:hypothetical protein